MTCLVNEVFGPVNHLGYINFLIPLIYVPVTKMLSLTNLLSGSSEVSSQLGRDFGDAAFSTSPCCWVRLHGPELRLAPTQ